MIVSGLGNAFTSLNGITATFAAQSNFVLNPRTEVKGSVTLTEHATFLAGGGEMEGAITLRDTSEINLVGGLNAARGRITFEGSAALVTGGTIRLNGGFANIGSIHSPNAAGRIGNADSPAASLRVESGDFGGVISDGLGRTPGGAVSLTVGGFGTLALTGTNTYTGDTRVESAATLNLDFTRAHSPSSHIVNPASALALVGGNLTITGRASGLTDQAFRQLALVGDSTVRYTGAHTVGVSVNFGAYADLTRQPGATLDFTLGSGLALLPGAPAEAPRYFTVLGRRSWAAFSGDEIVPFQAYASLWGAGLDTDVRSTQPATLAPGPDATTGTLRFAEAVANTVTLAGTNVLDKAAILVSPDVGNRRSLITGGELAPAGGGELLIIQGNTSNVLRIESKIVDGVVPTLVVKTGPGTLELAAPIGASGVATGGLRVLNGAVKIEGSVMGELIVTGAGVMFGNGRVGGPVRIGGHGAISPGRSPGTFIAESAEWQTDGIYQWEVNDATGLLGGEEGWDLFAIEQVLEITATIDAPFVLDLRSLTLANVSGDPFHFDPLQSYAWTIARAAGGVSGFDADAFEIVRTGFSSLADGSFGVALAGNDVQVTYTPAPEPTSALLLASGAAFLLVRRRQKIS